MSRKPTFRSKIKKYRKEKGFTQLEMATKVGISRSYVGHLEAGSRQPTISILQRFASTMKVSWTSLAT